MNNNNSDKHYYLPVIQDFFGSAEFALQYSNSGKIVVQTGKYNTWTNFRRLNKAGHNIFMRPAAEQESQYLLLDDLNSTKAEQHKQRPGRMIIETSPGNYQIWVHFEAALTNKQKTYLINQAGADQGATPERRWGRSPGFANHKHKYNQQSERWKTGRFPWVNLIAVTPGVTPLPAFPAILPTSTSAATFASTTILDLPQAPPGAVGIATQYYDTAINKNGATDISVIDFGLARKLIDRYSADQSAAAIVQCSPRIHERKGGRAGGAAAYAMLVVHNAINKGFKK